MPLRRPNRCRERQGSTTFDDAVDASLSYKWVLRVTASLCLGPAVGVGVARFAYGLLLPSMRAQMHWTYAFAGAMNTANAGGYLVGAALAASLARRWGARASFLWALGIAVASTAATAATGNPLALLSTRLLAGFGGAVCFTAGAGLVAAATKGLGTRRAAALLGLYFAGVGVGIVASGLGVPKLLAVAPAHSAWRWGWLLLGVVGAIGLAAAIPGTTTCREPAEPPAHDRTWPWRPFTPLLACYFLFGCGYIAYMTFIIAYLEERGTSSDVISVFWVVLGVSALVGSIVWMPASRLRDGRSASATLAVTGIGALIPLVSSSEFAAFASAVLFGGSFLAVVTAVTGIARRSLPPHHWASSIAALTTVFAVGQCVGPVLAGTLADRPGGLGPGLGLSTGILAVGAIVALRQRDLTAACARPAPTLGVGACADRPGLRS